MKTIYFFIKSFLYTIKYQRFVFLILLTVLSIASACLLYLYSYNNFLLNKNNEFSYDDRTYNVYIDSVSKENMKKFVMNVMNTMGSKTIFEISVIGSGRITNSQGKQVPQYIAAFYPQLNEYMFYREAGNFIFTPNKKEVILSPHILPEINAASSNILGEYMPINGNKYKVIGFGVLFRRLNNIPNVIVPYEFFYENVDTIKNINFVFDEKLKGNSLQQFLKLTEENLGHHQIVFPKQYSDSSKRSFIMKLVVTITLVFFSAVNIFGLFKYIIFRRRNEININRLCGATKRNVLISLLFEILLIDAFAFAFGLFIFNLAIPSIKKLDIYYPIGIEGYAFCGIILLLCSFIASIKMLYEFLSLNFIDIQKRS